MAQVTWEIFAKPDQMYAVPRDLSLEHGRDEIRAVADVVGRDFELYWHHPLIFEAVLGSFEMTGDLRHCVARSESPTIVSDRHVTVLV